MWISPRHALADVIDTLSQQARYLMLRGQEWRRRATGGRWREMPGHSNFEYRCPGPYLELRTKAPRLDLRTLKVIVYDNHLILRGGRAPGAGEGRPPRSRRISYIHQVALPADVDPIEIRVTYGGKVLRIRLKRAMVEPLGHPH